MLIPSRLVTAALFSVLAITGCGTGGEKSSSDQDVPDRPSLIKRLPDGVKDPELMEGNLAIFTGKAPTPIRSCQNITLDTAKDTFELVLADGSQLQVDVNTEDQKLSRVWYVQGKDDPVKAKDFEGVNDHGNAFGWAKFGAAAKSAYVIFKFDAAGCPSNPAGGGPREASEGAHPDRPMAASPNGVPDPLSLEPPQVQFARGKASVPTCTATTDKKGFVYTLTLPDDVALEVTTNNDFEVTQVRYDDGAQADETATKFSGEVLKGLVQGWAEFQSAKSFSLAFRFDGPSCL